MGQPFDVPEPLPLEEQRGQTFSALVRLMQRLLAPDGCPWDREQDPMSLRQYVIEEACEVVDAIEANDPKALREELGDLALQVVFLAELARKDGAAKLEQLRKGADAGLKWGEARQVSRREPQGLSGEVLRQVMGADAAKLPAYVGVPAGDSGYMLLRISKVIEGEPKAQQAERSAALLRAAQYDAYVASLRQQAEIDISQRNLEKR